MIHSDCPAPHEALGNSTNHQAQYSPLPPRNLSLKTENMMTNLRVAQSVKNLPANAGDAGSIPGLEIPSPWRRKLQPTPLLLPGESLGQRSLMDYTPWGCKESAMS